MLSGLTDGVRAARCSSGYVQKTVRPAPSACRSSAGRPRPSTATTSAPAGSTGRYARALGVPPTRKASVVPAEVAEGLDELEHHLVVLDRVDEAVAEAVPDAEDLVQPRQPRPALVRRAAGEVRTRRRSRRLGELPQPLEPGRGERLDAREQVEPRAGRGSRRARGRARPAGRPRGRRRSPAGGCRGGRRGPPARRTGARARSAPGRRSRRRRPRARSPRGQVADERAESLQLAERRLRASFAVGEAEVQLERVVPVRILVGEVVEVGVAPGEPAARSGEERRVEHLAVVVGGVVVGGVVRADPELLEDHGLAEAPGELAGERGGQQLPDLVVLHRVGVRADEVDERRERAQRVAVVAPRHLDAPRAVTERDRLRRPRSADGLDDRTRPGFDLVRGRRAAVERHLVRDEPADDRRMPSEATRELAGEPRLLRHEPLVAVEVAPVAPRRVPVLPGHVADDEGRDRPEPVLGVRVEEVVEPVETASSSRSGSGTKSGQKQNDRVTLSPCSASTRSSLADDRRRSASTCAGRRPATRSSPRATARPQAHRPVDHPVPVSVLHVELNKSLIRFSVNPRRRT